MTNKKSLMFFLVMCLFAVTVSTTLADDRINVVHHFGGDVLFCDDELGCRMLNINGEQLWDQPQAVIDALMAIACEEHLTQFLDAGMGTYGPASLIISCYAGMEPTITLAGYDEWGKLNTMQFAPDYQPVKPPNNAEKSKAKGGGGLEPTCSAFFDGPVGIYAIYHTVNGLLVDDDATFLFWSPTNLDLPKCSIA